MVRSTAFDGDARGPSMTSVVETLGQRGIKVDTMKIKVPTTASILYKLNYYSIYNST